MYWRSLWKGSGTSDVAEEERKKSWSFLSDKFGSQRAAWIALATKPKNWDRRAAENDPDFPKHDLTKSSSWSRAPRTNVLPDRLVALLYQGDQMVKEQTGALIPDELFLGPDPLEEDDSFKTDNGKLVFGSSFAWASDFGKAVDSGMGLRISVTPDQVRDGFSRVVVLGVMVSYSEKDSKEALEGLIENHHYSPKGFAIVPQGTPTNNSDEAEAGFTSRDPFNVASYFTETGSLFSRRKTTPTGGYSPMRLASGMRHCNTLPARTTPTTAKP